MRDGDSGVVQGPDYLSHPTGASVETDGAATLPGRTLGSEVDENLPSRLEKDRVDVHTQCRRTNR